MRKVTPETIEHVKRLEGCKLKAYPDPGSKSGEPWTIGYGHTSDGFMAVRKGMIITQADADAALEHDLNETASALDKLVKVPLTDNQFGALVSFVYNLGATQFKGSTLLKKLNAGNYDAVPGELAKWKYNDGKVMPGLVNRRAAEAGLWSRGAFVASRTVKAKSPPLVQKLTNPETLTAAGGVAAGITGLASGSGPVQWALAAVMVIVVLAVIYKLVLAK